MIKTLFEKNILASYQHQNYTPCNAFFLREKILIATTLKGWLTEMSVFASTSRNTKPLGLAHSRLMEHTYCHGLINSMAGQSSLLCQIQT